MSLSPTTSDDLATLAEQSLAAVTRQLTPNGFHVQGLDTGSRMVHMAGADGLCDLDLLADGRLVWECQPAAGTAPAQIRDQVMIILGADPPAERLSARYTGLPLISAAGRELADRGLTVRPVVIAVDEAIYDMYTGIEVANPACPARGLVQVAGDPALIWRCPLTPGGLSVQQIATTITVALRYPGTTR
jgi:hypothetical protein